MIAPEPRLQAARGIYLGREGASTAGDRWFSLYLIGFLVSFCVVPVAYIIGDSLDPQLAASLSDGRSLVRGTFGLLLLATATLWCGRVQGPASLTPFLAHTFLATDVGRRRVLAGPALRSVLGVAVVLCASASVVLFAMTHAGAWGWGRFGLLVAAAFSGGLHLGFAAFVGQRASRRALVLMSALLLITAGASAVSPLAVFVTPAGWASGLWAGESPWLLLPLTATAVSLLALMLGVPAALGRLPARRVLAQSQRLSSARLFTSTGNVNDAVELFRARPRRLRPGSAVQTSSGVVPTLLAGLRQDAVTAARAPISLMAAGALVPGGAALVAVAAEVVGQGFEQSRLVVTVPLAVIGALLLFFGTGSLTEGWRHLKTEFDAAALFGWSAPTALLRRLAWPLVLTGVLTGLGVVCVFLLSDLGWHDAVWTAGIAAIALAARWMQSMRSRDIPVEFLAPTVIPGSVDMSAVKILVWLGDGVILTVLGVLAAVVLPWGPQQLAPLLGALFLACVLWGWVRTGQRMFARAPRRHS